VKKSKSGSEMTSRRGFGGRTFFSPERICGTRANARQGRGVKKGEGKGGKKPSELAEDEEKKNAGKFLFKEPQEAIEQSFVEAGEQAVRVRKKGKNKRVGGESVIRRTKKGLGKGGGKHKRRTLTPQTRRNKISLGQKRSKNSGKRGGKN